MQPKKKTSKARKGWRRSHHALTPPQVDYCPKCSAPRGAHSACSRCGYFHPQVSLTVEQES